ncbi:MAG: hypothetical protein IJ435_04185 [Clostridia bacterium]|nr:hypothetical protein [Clostridia bacterium]
MKRSAKASVKNIDTAIKKKAENNITIVNCAVIIYALLLAVIASMSNSSVTVAGAAAIRRILFYCGIVGFMGIAAYAAYKSNKSFLKYSLMCLFVSITSIAALICNSTRAWGTIVTWVALGIALVFNMIYAYLTDKNLYYSSKKTPVVFKAVVGAVYAVLLVILILAAFKVI